MAVKTTALPTQDAYPEGDALQHQVTARQNRASLWRLLFVASTLVGIIALTALLYNILNAVFGYVAVQNAVDPHTLAIGVAEQSFLTLPALKTSEDDDAIAAGIAQDASAIGF
nr:hypothetical protein [Caldilineaceae bacterium]